MELEPEKKLEKSGARSRKKLISAPQHYLQVSQWAMVSESKTCKASTLTTKCARVYCKTFVNGKCLAHLPGHRWSSWWAARAGWSSCCSPRPPGRSRSRRWPPPSGEDGDYRAILAGRRATERERGMEGRGGGSRKRSILPRTCTKTMHQPGDQAEAKLGSIIQKEYLYVRTFLGLGLTTSGWGSNWSSLGWVVVVVVASCKHQ